MKHGEERTKRQIVDNGRAEYLRREKYCVRDGWIDVLAAGGDVAWLGRHGSCDGADPSGVAFKTAEAAQNKRCAESVSVAPLPPD